MIGLKCEWDFLWSYKVVEDEEDGESWELKLGRKEKLFFVVDKIKVDGVRVVRFFKDFVEILEKKMDEWFIYGGWWIGDVWVGIFWVLGGWGWKNNYDVIRCGR